MTGCTVAASNLHMAYCEMQEGERERGKGRERVC